MSDSGNKAVWWEVLCSEDSDSAGLRHAPLIWDGGWLSGGGSPSQPVHSPAADARFHGRQGVALRSVRTRQHLVDLWAAHLLWSSRARRSLSKQRQQTRSRSGARGPTRTHTRALTHTGTKKKKKTQKDRVTEKGQSVVLSVSVGEDRSPATLTTGAALSWLPLYHNEKRLGKFQRVACGKDPAHSVETLGGSSAERASSKQRQCSGEQAAVCRSCLSGGLRQNLAWSPHARGLGVWFCAGD